MECLVELLTRVLYSSEKDVTELTYVQTSGSLYLQLPYVVVNYSTSVLKEQFTRLKIEGRGE